MLLRQCATNLGNKEFRILDADEPPSLAHGSFDTQELEHATHVGFKPLQYTDGQDPQGTLPDDGSRWSRDLPNPGTEPLKVIIVLEGSGQA